MKSKLFNENVVLRLRSWSKTEGWLACVQPSPAHRLILKILRFSFMRVIFEFSYANIFHRLSAHFSLGFNFWSVINSFTKQIKRTLSRHMSYPTRAIPRFQFWATLRLAGWRKYRRMLLRPRPHVSGNFWKRNFFFLRIRLASTRIQKNIAKKYLRKKKFPDTCGHGLSNNKHLWTSVHTCQS